MRIITGTARGTKLETLDGEATRPTTEMAKEGIFSSVQFDIEGRRILDLFAGSGQMGLEALSRGAQSCVFIDNSAAAAAIIKKNAQKTKLFPACKVSCMDYTEYLKSVTDKDVKFDYIFVDPPYDLKLCPEVVKKIFKSGCIHESSLIYCESDSADFDLDVINSSVFGKAEIVKQYKYGKTFVHVIRRVD
ncbi:MAG: 16S rRNA (guanine(966)-N(2))-methyltransferase RsmD [Ruminococcaceae bacterium]|nr:16S rRNA (guanine(966)-N(2))-methyltransferase RsmD [Oscillospiraceae bacterium]